MYQYKKHLRIKVKDVKPCANLYYEFDRHYRVIDRMQRMLLSCIRDGVMFNNKTFYQTYLTLGASIISDMEVSAKFTHALRGMDVHFYDESNDDTPCIEYIKMGKGKLPNKSKVYSQISYSVKNLLCMQDELLVILESILNKGDDDTQKEVIKGLIKESRWRKDQIEVMNNILNTHEEIKDFGEGCSHNSFDMDTSNYFDKMNPYFITISDIINLKEE